MQILTRTPPPSWRSAAVKRPLKQFSKRDIRIVGTVASVSAWAAGAGWVGSLATSVAVPVIAKITGLSG